MILDNMQLWEKYNAFATEKEKHLFLKNYLLSLKPQQLFDFLSADVDNLGVNIIELVAKGSLSQTESKELSSSLDSIVEKLDKTRTISKAA